ncbi:MULTISPECIES: 5'/3'-nucleotidase SurE [Prochlorococcus]|uniref:5'-nucleotidase SurE n=1 Tax=Prochlorococcus marinus (strain SARG / CCMP1375 / SS120) TaxID=167539 RepID=SURE_PROMA|nr:MULTISPECIES: 5'/3'-nucleotidase SurE [Prochlorococcus]Q7VAV8.1 RecName: Full=5'-nucleotidase SurE; AltName: Full=Nucleoside 5'-monophosphate phosphohydrolase [Prochlorococcus marinus subsp. marinus str. CCMP1375]AAQ00389.1 Predicted acid phosphatase [Prochlorococcus marinus subsp. marinus str. CCMP1375]
MKPLKILISNDDGVFAEGIRTLAIAAASRGHEVTVVCPDQERSATGHGLTLQAPIRAERADELFNEGIQAWGCSGTPADCVKLALNELLKEKPDLILSGINHGPNLGTDIFCSGTVAAALEGTLEGIPSLAVSIASFQWRKFKLAGELALNIAENAINQKWPKKLLLNLNIPPCDSEQMGKPGWTRLSIRQYQEQFSKRKDPRGNAYYWLAGEAVKDLESAGDGPKEWPSDVSQIETNSPSLTPIQPDLFWRGNVNDLPKLN